MGTGTAPTADFDMKRFVVRDLARDSGRSVNVVLDGRNSAVAHGVEAALGRPARDFADFARQTAATGIWRA